MNTKVKGLRHKAKGVRRKVEVSRRKARGVKEKVISSGLVELTYLI